MNDSEWDDAEVLPVHYRWKDVYIDGEFRRALHPDEGSQAMIKESTTPSARAFLRAVRKRSRARWIVNVVLAAVAGIAVGTLLSIIILYCF